MLMDPTPAVAAQKDETETSAAEVVISKIDKRPGTEIVDKFLPPPTAAAASLSQSRNNAAEMIVPTIRHHYLADELVQLTCSFELNDELDLDYSQLEWWLISANDDAADDDHQQPLAAASAAKKRPAAGRLIWRSQRPSAQTIVTKTASMKDEPGVAGQATIMDYVTRARRASFSDSLARPTDGRPSSSLSSSSSSMNQSNHRSSLVRVSHLIADAAKIGGNNRVAQTKQQQQQRRQHDQRLQPDHDAKKTTMRLSETTKTTPPTVELLCRVTNQAGHAELLHSVLVDSNSRQAQLEARARQQAQDSWLGRRHENNLVSRLASGSDSIPSSIERAKARILEELEEADASFLNSDDDLAPLFLPLYLPGELLSLDVPMDSINGSGDASKEIEFGLDADELAARSLSQQQQQPTDLHQRQATRQINATASAPAKSSDPNSTLTLARLMQASSATYRQKLQSKALALVRKFTSTKLAAGQVDEDEFGPNYLAGDILGESTAARSDSNESEHRGKLRLWWRAVYVRYLDRWLQLAIGEAPLLLGICAGLFIGCLLTTFFLLRLHCTSQRRIGDLEPADSSSVGIRTMPEQQQHQLKSSQSDSSASESYANLNYPAAEDDVGSSMEDKKQPTGGSSSETNDTSQRRLLSIASPEFEFEPSTKLKSMTLTRNGRARFSSTDFSHSHEQPELEITQTATGNYSTLDCQRRGYRNEDPMDNGHEHRLIVVSPGQEMQELILSPYLPFGNEQASVHHHFLQQPHVGGGDLCQHQVGWQSPSGYLDASACSSSFQQSVSRPPELMMTAPSKLRSIEALDSLYQTTSSTIRNSTSLSRNLCLQDKQQFSARPAAGPNHGYASSSSLFTSPAASTSSTSMTSGIAATMTQQHSAYACNHQPNRLDNNELSYQQQQNHIIYLDDALKLLHSTINDCQ